MQGGGRNHPAHFYNAEKGEAFQNQCTQRGPELALSTKKQGEIPCFFYAVTSVPAVIGGVFLNLCMLWK